MTTMGKHDTSQSVTQPAGKVRHQWVIWVIAAAVGLEIWGTWVDLGSLLGFPVAPVLWWHVPTNWTLAFTTEAYAAYAVYAWMSAPSSKSGRFAMWTAIGTIIIGWVAQGTYHRMLADHLTRAPGWLVIGAACLPSLVLMLGGILMHMTHADSRKAEAAAATAAKADEVARLNRKLAEVTASATAEIADLRESASAAEGGKAEAEARAEAEGRQVSELTAAVHAEGIRLAAATRELEGLAASRDESEAALRTDLGAVRRSLEDAELRAGKAEDRARKLASAADRAKGGTGTRKTGTGTRSPAGTAPGTAASGTEDLVPPEGLSTEDLVQWWVGKGKSPSQAGILADVSDSRGRAIMREINKRSFRVLDGEEQTG